MLVAKISLPCLVPITIVIIAFKAKRATSSKFEIYRKESTLFDRRFIYLDPYLLYRHSHHLAQKICFIHQWTFYHMTFFQLACSTIPYHKTYLGFFDKFRHSAEKESFHLHSCHRKIKDDLLISVAIIDPAEIKSKVVNGQSL